MSSNATTAGSGPLRALTDAGVSIWLDELSRQRLVGGGLERLIRDRHVTLDNPHLAARDLRPNRLGTLIEHVSPTRGERDNRTFLGECRCDATPDARAATGNQCMRAVERAHDVDLRPGTLP